MTKEERLAELRKRFDLSMERWLSTHQPSPAVAIEALQAFAWEWFLHGAEFMQRQLSGEVQQLAVDLNRSQISDF